MSKTGSLIANLQAYATRPDWEPLLGTVFREHLQNAADALGLAPGDIGPLVGAQSGEFIATVFEDFATRARADGNCLAADYLKRAGWRENGYAQQYLEAFIDSQLRLYEVTDVQPGVGLELRPLKGPKGQPAASVFVHEKAGSKGLRRWDVISARVLRVQDEYVLAGGVLPVRPGQATDLLKAHARLSKAGGPDPMPSLCTTAWVAWLYDSQTAPHPTLVNRDGDEILMGKSRLPLQGSADDIAALLDTLPGWESAPDQPRRWVWLASGQAPAASAKSRRKAAEGSPAGTLLGEAVLEPRHLEFTTNSRQRMERGLQILQQAIGDRVGPALTSYTPVDLNDLPAPGGNAPEEMPSPEEQAAMILAVMDRHYRETLRQPVPALGNKTPVQAVKTKVGRARVIAWLKELERNTAAGNAAHGMPPYDFGWMWDELGLTAER